MTSHHKKRATNNGDSLSFNDEHDEDEIVVAGPSSFRTKDEADSDEDANINTSQDDVSNDGANSYAEPENNTDMAVQQNSTNLSLPQAQGIHMTTSAYVTRFIEQSATPSRDAPTAGSQTAIFANNLYVNASLEERSVKELKKEISRRDSRIALSERLLNTEAEKVAALTAELETLKGHYRVVYEERENYKLQQQGCMQEQERYRRRAEKAEEDLRHWDTYCKSLNDRIAKLKHKNKQLQGQIDSSEKDELDAAERMLETLSSMESGIPAWVTSTNLMLTRVRTLLDENDKEVETCTTQAHSLQHRLTTSTANEEQKLGYQREELERIGIMIAYLQALPNSFQRRELPHNADENNREVWNLAVSMGRANAASELKRRRKKQQSTITFLEKRISYRSDLSYNITKDITQMRNSVAGLRQRENELSQRIADYGNRHVESQAQFQALITSSQNIREEREENMASACDLETDVQCLQTKWSTVAAEIRQHNNDAGVIEQELQKLVKFQVDKRENQVASLEA